MVSLLIYIVSYVAWFAILGSGFNDHNGLRFWEYIWQYLDVRWLQQDLAGSLLNLHSQPPLMNFLISIIFKIAPEYYEIIFRTLHFLMGAWAVIAIERTLRVFAISRAVCIISMILLCALPSFYMMNTWYYTAHLEFCFVAIALYGMAKYVHERHLKNLILVFICFALLGLLRAQWHLALFVLIAVMLAGQRKKVLLLSLIFILPIGGWYAKNQAIFGFFGASSWVGANLSEVVSKAPPDTVAMLKAEKKIAENYPVAFEFTPTPGSVTHPSLEPYKIPGIRNRNYIGMVASAKQDLHDSIIVISYAPLEYIAATIARLPVALAYPTFTHQAMGLTSAATLFDKLPGTILLLCTIIAMTASFGFYALIPAWMFFLARRQNAPARRFFMICFIMIGFILLTACALNDHEQERMRWSLVPIFVLFAAIFLENARKWWNSKRHGRTA